MHPVQPARIIFIEPRAEPAPSIEDLRSQIISNVAWKTLHEFLVSMTFSGVSCLFVATPSGIALLVAGTVTMVALNLLIRAASGYATLCAHALRRENRAESEQSGTFYQTFIHFANYLCPINFSRIDCATRDTLVHETGHALAVLLLLQNALPEITIDPFEGGLTTFDDAELSRFGNWLGEELVASIIAGAGGALAVICATGQLIAGHTLSTTYPELSRYLKITGVVSILENMVYAASGLKRTCSRSHDFHFLWKSGGIHPVTCVALMALLPLIAKIILYGIDCLQRE
ncbi:MAG: hypothetical protein ACHQT8_05470 [Chlamydiales bacterium]